VQENGLKMPNSQRMITIITQPGNYRIIMFKELENHSFKEKYWIEVEPFLNFDHISLINEWLEGKDIADLHSDLMISMNKNK